MDARRPTPPVTLGPVPGRSSLRIQLGDGKMSMFALAAALLSMVLKGESASNRGTCDTALGMERGNIRDMDLSASSSYARTLGPEHGRVRVENGSGAWCPRTPIQPGVREWLQIDLRSNQVVTGIETQGRFGNGQGQEFTEAFVLEYWRDALGKWVVYKNSEGQQILPGNTNPWLALKQSLDPPLIARKLRILPYSNHSRTSCLRVEIYGCPDASGLQSYTARKGSPSSETTVDFIDSSYDGGVEGGRLIGGLGKLTDTVIGPGSEYYRTGATPFVGWQKDPEDDSDFNEITFHFASLKKFSSVVIYAAKSYPPLDVGLPDRIVIQFSLDDVTWSPRELAVSPDWSLRNKPGSAQIDLEGRMAVGIKLRIHFSGKWMLISEMDFQCENFSGDIIETNHQLPDISYQPPKATTGLPVQPSEPEELPQNKQQTLIVLVSGLFATGILLFAGLTVIFVRKCYKNTPKSFSATGVYPSSAEKKLTLSLKHLMPGRGQSIRPGDLFAPAFVNEGDNDSNSTLYQEPYAGFVKVKPDEFGSIVKDPVILTPKSFSTNGIYQNGILHPALVKLTPSIQSLNRMHSQSMTSFYPPANHNEGFYATTDIINGSRPILQSLEEEFDGDESALRFSSYLMPATTPSNVEDFDLPEIPLCKVKAREKLGGGDFGTYAGWGYAQREVSIFLLDLDFMKNPIVLVTIQRKPIIHPDAENLNLKKKPAFPRVTDAKFRKVPAQESRKVHLFDVEGIPGSGNVCHVSSKRTFVGRTIFTKGSGFARQRLLRDIRHLSSLRDPTVAKVVALTSQIASDNVETSSMTIVFTEYLENGHLCNYLSQQRISSTEESAGTMSFGGLTYIASQVASAMRYLESLGFIHRDLSARNVLIGRHLAVKITDIASYRLEFARDYCSFRGKHGIPVRWMPPEVILMDDWSHKSDVWSFGVLLWEILNLCQQRPWSTYSDIQILTAVLDKNSPAKKYSDDEVGLGALGVLPRPLICPPEFYHLMSECWRIEPTRRPKFSEIVMFLQRKNMGFNPSAY